MKKIFITTLSVLLAVSFFSCGSKPAPEEPTEPEAPVVTEPEKPKEEPKKEEVVEKKVDNTLALETLGASRTAAVESGADKTAADKLAALDDEYNAIKAKAEEGKDVSADSENLANKYMALASYVKALEAKKKINDTNLFHLAQSVYDEGNQALEDLEILFADPNSSGKEMLDKATKAAACFDSVLIVIYKKLAKDERTQAYVAKKDADSVKAGVSQKEKYTEGVECFKKGDSLYAMQNAAKAYENYQQAKEIFTNLYNDIYEKRAAAQKAIEEAKKRVAESETFAEQADSEAPIKEKIAGIEDEDAVLLEKDNYENPEDAEIDVSETVDDSLEDAIPANVKNSVKSVLGDEK